VHDSTPELASEPPKVTISGWLYQSFESGALDGVALTVGAEPSYWKLNARASLTLPALSRHEPVTDALPESGPSYRALEHDSIPDVASAPGNETESWWLYQPFSSGDRSGFGDPADGAVASYPNVAAPPAVLPATSLHVPVTLADAESGPAYVVDPSQDATPDVTSDPVTLTPTLRLYQPLESGARLGVAVTFGLVSSNLNWGELRVVLVLPALSVQVPLTVAVALSGLV